MPEEYDICPKCYSHIDKYVEGTPLSRIKGELGEDDFGEPLPFWTEDPVLTPLGLSGENYKGLTFWRWIHIQELRNYYNELEELSGLEETDWTDEFATGKKVIFKHIHIEELRIAIEKLLEDSGLTLEDYFKSDKYGEEHESSQTDWTDVDRNNENSYPLLPNLTRIKAIHLEELRIGFISLPIWITRVSTFSKVVAIDDKDTINLRKELSLGVSFLDSKAICTDKQFIYTCTRSFSPPKKFQKSDGTHLETASGNYHYYDIVADENFIWTVSASKGGVAYLPYDYRIRKFDKDLNTIDANWFDIGGFPASTVTYFYPCIATDKDFLYVTALKYPEGVYIIYKINKVTKVSSSYLFSGGDGFVSGIGIDDNYIYIITSTSGKLIKMSKNLSIISSYNISDLSSSYFPPQITAGKKNLYILVTPSYPLGKLMIYDKNGIFIGETTTINSYSIYTVNPLNQMFAEVQYKQVLSA